MYVTDRETVYPSSPHFVSSSAPIEGGLSDSLSFFSGEGRANISLSAVHGYNSSSILTFEINVFPAFGSLFRVDTGGQILPGSPLSVASTDLSGFIVQYEPNASYTDEDAFSFNVSDGSSSTSGRVVVQTVVIETPSDVKQTVKEDEILPLGLGAIGVDGTPLEVYIETLPSLGLLYHPWFDDSHTRYIDLASSPERENAMQFTDVGERCNNSRGVAIYIPDTDVNSLNSSVPLSSFTYRQCHPTLLIGGEKVCSGSATVVIVVEAVNDAPVIEGGSVYVNDTSPLILQLDSSDVDGSFSEKVFYRVSTLPRFGTLYIPPRLNTRRGGMIKPTPFPIDGLLPVATIDPPTLIAYASKLLDFSTQFTRCNCQLPGDCGPLNICPDGSLDYHAATLMGPPDVYPFYASSKNSWAMSDSFSLSHEYIVLEYPYALFISAITIYETQSPGAVVAVYTTDLYGGSLNQTTWTLLWKGEPTSEGDHVRAFSPSLCPPHSPTSVVRIDIDNSFSHRWHEIDAVQISGSTIPPKGSLKGQDQVVYVPSTGIYHKDDGMIDSFQIVGGDCEKWSDVPATFEVYHPRYNFTSSSSGRSSSSLDPSLVVWRAYAFSLSLSDTNRISVNVSDVVFDLQSRGIEVEMSVVQLSLTSISSFSNTIPEINGVIPSTLPLSFPPNTTTYTISSHPQQGITQLTFILHVDDYEYVLSHSLSLSCEGSLYARDADGVCVPCEDISTAQLNKMGSEERGRFLNEVCVLEYQYTTGLLEAMQSLSSLFILFSLGIAYLLFKHRNERVIKASTPELNYFILFGCILSFCVVFLISLPPNLSRCIYAPATGHVAFVLVYSSLFIKTHRLAKIFTATRLRTTFQTTKELILKVVVATVCTMVYLSISFSLYPPHTTTYHDGYYKTTVCSSSTPWMLHLLYIGESLMLVWGVILCVQIRGAPGPFNESRFIGIAIYTTALIASLCIPLLMYFIDDPSTVYLLTSLSLIVIGGVIVISLFIPKLLFVFYHQIEEGTDISARKSSGLNATAASDFALRTQKIGVFKANKYTVRDTEERRENERGGKYERQNRSWRERDRDRGHEVGEKGIRHHESAATAATLDSTWMIRDMTCSLDENDEERAREREKHYPGTYDTSVVHPFHSPVHLVINHKQEISPISPTHTNSLSELVEDRTNVKAEEREREKQRSAIRHRREVEEEERWRGGEQVGSPSVSIPDDRQAVIETPKKPENNSPSVSFPTPSPLSPPLFSPNSPSAEDNPDDEAEEEERERHEKVGNTHMNPTSHD